MLIEEVITLRPDEEILAVIRSHWVTKLGTVVSALLLACVPLFFLVPLFRLGTWGASTAAAMLFFAAWFAYRKWYLWHWNVFIVTTERVVDVDQRGFFRRIVSEADFARIEDVSFRTKGAFGAVFGYGTLHVRASNGSLVIELANAPDPQEAHALITDAMTAVRDRVPALGDERASATGKSRRVSQLLDAAAELDPSEARAFMSAVEGAARKKEARTNGVRADGDLTWLKDEDESN